MALPTTLLPGFSYKLFMQTGATPVALTTANLSVYTGQVANIATLDAAGTAGVQVPVQEVPSWGLEDASATTPIAGSRFADKFPVQGAPKSMECKLNLVHADEASTTTAAGIIKADALKGTVDRTFVIAASDGAATPKVYYFAFNGRIGAYSQDAGTGEAVGTMTFTIHPRGGQYGTTTN